MASGQGASVADHKGRSRRNRLFLTFLASNILLLLFPVAVGMASYVNAYRVAKRGAEEHNAALLQHARAVLDGHLQSIDRLTIDVALNAQIARFLSVRRPFAPEDLYRMSLVVDELAKYRNTFAFVSAVYVYFSVSDVVLGANAKYEPERFPRRHLPPDPWRELMRRHHARDYLAVGEAGDRILYLQSLPIGISGESQGTLAVEIDRSVFDQLLGETIASRGGGLYVATRDRRVLFYLGSDSLEHSDVPEPSAALIATELPSKAGPWTYVSVVPEAAFARDLRSITFITAVVILAQLGLGFLLAVLLARQSAGPIRRIVESLQRLLGPDLLIEDVRRQGSVIAQATDESLRRGERTRREMTRMRRLLVSELLSRLIRGAADVEAERALLEADGTVFELPLFTVVLLVLPERSSGTPSLESRTYAKTVVTRLVSEAFRGRPGFRMVDLDWDRMAVLLNHGSEVSTKDVVGLMSSTQELLEAKFSLFVVFSVGPPGEGVAGIHLSYRQALRATERQLLDGSLPVEGLRQERGGSLEYDFPVETEQALMNQTKSGEATGVRRIIEDLFLSHQGRSRRVVRCLVYDLAATLMRILTDLGIDPAEVMNGQGDPVSAVAAAGTIEGSKEALAAHFGMICDYVLQHRKSRNQELRARIEDFLAEHQDDRQLSLAMAADFMGLSPSYLSHFFKDQFGENFVSYLMRSKLERAKALLRETDLPVDEVARRVGYAGGSVLIRNFRRWEGMTPGQYRENLIRLLER
jgi:AraC-like DNA-binding protein